MNPPEIILSSNAEILEKNCSTDLEYIISGEVTGNNISLKINNKESNDFKVENHSGQFDLFIGEKSLKDGWNYIEVSAKWPLTRWIQKSSFFINIIPNQAAVFVPTSIVMEAREYNKLNVQQYSDKLVENYEYDSAYFGFKPLKETNERMTFDNSGIPMVKYGESYHYNPVTIAESALGFYNEYKNLNDNYNMNMFLNLANWFVNNQEDNGAFSYDFSTSFRGVVDLPEGFVSAMAQGQVLSVMARAYNITNDKKYLECGEKTLLFMISSGDEDIFAGCSRTLEDFCNLSDDLNKYANYRLFEEYVFDPSTYVLNGNLFALIGLYDWTQCSKEKYGKEEAYEAFEDGIRAIEILLPYYDYYGWSSYDLFQYTFDGEIEPAFNSSYAHICHIYLLKALADVTGNDTYEKYYETFKSYVDDDFWKQTSVMYDGK